MAGTACVFPLLMYALWPSLFLSLQDGGLHLFDGLVVIGGILELGWHWQYGLVSLRVVRLVSLWGQRFGYVRSPPEKNSFLLFRSFLDVLQLSSSHPYNDGLLDVSLNYFFRKV